MIPLGVVFDGKANYTNDFVVDMAHLDILRDVSTDEVSRVHLSWWVGEDVAGRVMTKAGEIAEAWTPIASRRRDTLEASIMKTIDRIEESLVNPDNADVPDQEFFDFFSEKKLVALRKDRTSLKNMSAELRKSGETCGDMVDTINDVLQRAKHQTVKWGLLAFTLNEETSQNNQRGADLRKLFKGIWELNCTDADFKKYLGETAVANIDTLLQGPPAKKKRIEKKLAGESSGGTAVKRGADGAAASVKKKRPRDVGDVD
jgi:hypothetical protein